MFQISRKRRPELPQVDSDVTNMEAPTNADVGSRYLDVVEPWEHIGSPVDPCSRGSESLLNSDEYDTQEVLLNEDGEQSEPETEIRNFGPTFKNADSSAMDLTNPLNQSVPMDLTATIDWDENENTTQRYNSLRGVDPDDDLNGHNESEKALKSRGKENRPKQDRTSILARIKRPQTGWSYNSSEETTGMYKINLKNIEDSNRSRNYYVVRLAHVHYC